MEFDFDFRPESYGSLAIGTDPSRVKGTVRRSIAMAAEAEGLPIDEMPGAQESLSAEDRQMWGRIHPAMMGGEFLPDLEANEIEIVRVDLASTTADAISIRAQWDGGKIRYRVVDEYGTNYVPGRLESDEPLTLGEVIELIDETEDVDNGFTGFSDEFRDGYRDLDPDELVDFVRISSEFYPHLEDYYDERAQAWARDRREAPDEVER